MNGVCARTFKTCGMTMYRYKALRRELFFTNDTRVDTRSTNCVIPFGPCMVRLRPDTNGALSLCEPIVSTSFGTPYTPNRPVQTVSTPFDESRGPPQATQRPVTDTPVTKCVNATSRRALGWRTWMSLDNRRCLILWLISSFGVSV